MIAALAACVLGIAPLLFLLAPQEPPRILREDLSVMSVEEPPPPMTDYALAAPAAPGQAPGQSNEPPEQASAPGAIARTAPRIAYAYGYRFRLAADAVAPLQERHLALCQGLGEARCRVVSMQRGQQQQAGGEEAASAGLTLEVAAPLAARFGAALASSANEAGGETIDRNIAAEDLSPQMVDSEARIRTRETLIRRLSILLETRSGNIEQAVQAERAINQAQEELDAARTWLAEMRGRVAMSKVEIGYEAVGAASAAAERGVIAETAVEVAKATAQSFMGLLFLIGIAAPWAAVLLLVYLAIRRHRRLHPDAL
jgi:hypothetical protein